MEINHGNRARAPLTEELLHINAPSNTGYTLRSDQNLSAFLSYKHSGAGKSAIAHFMLWKDDGAGKSRTIIVSGIGRVRATAGTNDEDIPNNDGTTYPATNMVCRL